MQTTTAFKYAAPPRLKAGKWTNPTTDCDHHAVFDADGKVVAVLPLDNGTEEFAHQIAGSGHVKVALEVALEEVLLPIFKEVRLDPTASATERGLIASYCAMAKLALLLSGPAPKLAPVPGSPMPRANWPLQGSKPPAPAAVGL
ncbi:MAG: hypothetical protein AB1698_01500 [Pseudomonadota bacterium]